jgi:hypothetical protein
MPSTSAPTRLHGVPVCAALVALVVAGFGRALAVPPVEYPRLLAVLPLDPRLVLRSKRLYLGWRTLWPLVLGTLPALIRRAPWPLVAGVLAAGLVGLVAGAWLARWDRAA